MNLNPEWHRTRLSKEICKEWQWKTLNGQLKDMACRTMLRKLEKSKIITLPRRITRNNFKVIENSDKNLSNEMFLFKNNEIMSEDKEIKEIIPIKINNLLNGTENNLFKNLLKQHHYLGFKQHVGEHMKYLVYDNHNNPVACLLFGSSAWTIECRDKYIGWDKETRIMNLNSITNNMRFLILPWIKIRNLASHILSQISRRIVNDWIVIFLKHLLNVTSSMGLAIKPQIGYSLVKQKAEAVMILKTY
jgi:hypothetical protein